MANTTGGGVARGALLSLVGQWAQYVVQIGSVVVFSRLLTPSEIGLVTAATAITGVAWVLSDLGLSLAALQADELSKDQKTMLFWANAGIGTLTTIAVGASAPLLAYFYDDPRILPIVLAGSSCFLCFGLAAQFEVAITRAGRFGLLSAIGVASQVSGLAAGVLVILLGGSYWGLVASPIVIIVVRLIGAVLGSGWWPGLPRRGVPMRHLYRFGGATLGLHLVTYATYNADSIAIGRVLGNAPLGLYNRAYQLSQVPALQLASPLTKVFLPALSRRRHDPAAYQALAWRIQLFLGYILGGGLALMLVESPAMIDIAFGDGWEGSAGALRLLCLAAILEMVGKIYYWAMLSWARTALLFKVELGPRLVTIALIIFLVPHGIEAVAWAVVAGQALALVLGAIFVLPAAGLPRGPFIGLLLRPAAVTGLASLAAAAVLAELPGSSALLDMLVGTAVWLAVLAVLALVPIVRADLAEIVDSAAALRRRRGGGAGNAEEAGAEGARVAGDAEETR